LPGPGSYEEAGKISSGAQVCTRFHSTITKNMKTTSPRSRWGGNPRFATPGPGSYRPPSDFGYLEFKSQVNGHFHKRGNSMMQKQTSEAQDVDSIAESNLDANLMLKIDKINSQAISI